MKICNIRTISRFIPYFKTESSILNDNRKEYISYADLNQTFWNEILNWEKIENDLKNEAKVNNSIQYKINHQIDLAACYSLAEVKNYFDNLENKMIAPDSLLYSARVLIRVTEIISRFNNDFFVNLYRGIVLKNYDQHDIKDIKSLLENQSINSFLTSILNNVVEINKYNVFLFNINNTIELFQVFLISNYIRTTNCEPLIILDLSGANEQFNFKPWIKVFNSNKDFISKFIDFIIPFQDYGLTLKTIFETVKNKGKDFICSYNYDNLLIFNEKYRKNSINEKIQDDIFADNFIEYVNNSTLFSVANRKTLITRLLPTKCIWAKCKFCAINSQHYYKHPRKLQNTQIDKIINNLIKKIKIDKINSIIFSDECLSLDVIEKFAEALINNNIDMIYRIRTRFSNNIDKYFAKKLAKSGCRFIGLGLETANIKSNIFYGKTDKNNLKYNEIIQVLDEAGTNPHVYSIVGFPTENKKEILKTKKFLLQNIKKRKYFTVSPNQFFLMKGTYIEANPEIYNIQVMPTSDFSLVSNFKNSNQKINEKIIKSSILEIHQEQFTPFSTDKTFSELYWHFIDQTGLFYLQKELFQINPYRISKPSKVSEDKYVDFNKYFIIQESEETYLLINWITFDYIKLNKENTIFIQKYNQKITIKENIEKIETSKGKIEKFILFQTLHDKNFFKYREE